MSLALSPRISIVLSRPEGSVNIGSACRAMKSMGVSQLKLVAPRKLDLVEIKRWSPHAYDIFESALLFDELKDAVKDCAWTVGTSRRTGKKRKHTALSPEKCAQATLNYGSGEVAIVFGNERTGLTDEELDLCHSVVYIETNDACASLNLSHAVQVICYEISKVVAAKTDRGVVTGDKVTELTDLAMRHLDDKCFFAISQDYGRTQTRRAIYDILGRAALSGGDAKFLANLFNQMRYFETEHYQNGPIEK